MDQPVPPISFADFSGAPVPKAEAATTEAAPPPQAIIYTTIVRIYVTRTGNDPGSSCELKSQVYLSNNATQTASIDVSINTDFSHNNNGLGLLLIEMSRPNINAPLNFNATAYEEGGVGSGNRYFIQRPIDFARNPEFMDGRVWTWKQWNTSDSNYVGHTEWQVVRRFA
ncbi:hypothetical protein W97_03145 [Coniosporium apollinis CBS 100218]|uniref:Uncharacterized protein n=1 Tax=Coniosporium apollinis (strain CBS 100218) TaxID=1168221 RepID=R7YPU2_CONA1|nr:uncharacterized protein W97_03145 [Coniosporium apollinis CBS 100218]EON63917.1 hypothetical protein W97_03145 [Coniosporium apollinis CBS 100218]